MLTLRFISSSLMAGIVLVGSLSVSSAQQAKQVDISKMTCRGFLLMDGTERENTALFLHGFISGKKNQQIVDVAALADANDKLLRSCIDKPDTSLLKMFEASRG